MKKLLQLLVFSFALGTPLLHGMDENEKARNLLAQNFIWGAVSSVGISLLTKKLDQKILWHGLGGILAWNVIYRNIAQAKIDRPFFSYCPTVETNTSLLLFYGLPALITESALYLKKGNFSRIKNIGRILFSGK